MVIILSKTQLLLQQDQKKNWLFSFEFQSKKIPLIFAIDLLLFFFTSQG
jgi:hypothetical protein